jgi:hypothetical protein
MTELFRALELLEKLGKEGAAPSHYVARHLLLSLGAALREGGADRAPEVDRARRAGAAAGKGWWQAVEAELALALAEFTQSVDLRYLGLPNYDLEYTLSARARLEDRLRAARALGWEPTPRELEMLALADQVLEAHRARRSAGN